MEERAQDGEYECNANASDAPGSGLWSPPPSPGKQLANFSGVTVSAFARCWGGDGFPFSAQTAS